MTDRSRPPTLQTIADVMGVSRTTVSNAYNRPDQLTAELRERIFAVADELGYAGPNPSARSLRRGTTGAIGVVLTGTLAYAFAQPTAVAFLRGMAEAGEDADLGLLLLPARRSDAAETGAIRNAMVDGFVMYSVPPDHPAVQVVTDRRLPTVTVNEPDLGTGSAYIGIDNEAGAAMAAQHLLDLGHRDIAVVTSTLRLDGYSGRVDGARRRAITDAIRSQRLGGYERSLAAAGIEWNDVTIYEAGENTPQAARASAAAILENEQPTAILATSDQLALGVLLEAAARDLRVPDELSVVGFDDVPRASVSNPPLTTIRQPLFEKGRIAVRMLENLAGDLRVELPIEFMERRSTGPAPRR